MKNVLFLTMLYFSMLPIKLALATDPSTLIDPPTIVVTGTLSPDATGTYVVDTTFNGGKYNGRNYYSRVGDSAFHILNRGGSWGISSSVPIGTYSTYLWLNYTGQRSPVGNNFAPSPPFSSGTLTMTDPNAPPPYVPPAVSTPATPPAWPSKLQITGTLSPDATGIYDMQPANQPGNFFASNGFPVYVREGDGAFSICFDFNGAMVLTQGACNWNSPLNNSWLWSNYGTIFTNGHNGTNGNDTQIQSTSSSLYTGTATMAIVDQPGFPTPDEYLANQPHPVFKPGNTLPPLTKFSWAYDYGTTAEMGKDWGYALDLGDATTGIVGNLSDPTTREAQLVALVQNNPSLYKLEVEMPRAEDSVPATSGCYDTDGNGNLLSPQTWSPQCPDSVMENLAAGTQSNLQQITALAPISIILNGGERGLSLYGNVGGSQTWAVDPAVLAAKGSLSWSDYQSQRKTHQEMVMTNAAHSVSNGTYIYYGTGGGGVTNMDGGGNWWYWAYDYQWTNPISDLPSNEAYYINDSLGWMDTTDNRANDELSLQLNAVAYAISLGKPLSYNWLSAGWSDPQNSYDSDIPRYMGFLKSYYTAGMIGGNAGYYALPANGFDAWFDQNAPPFWVLQVEALGQVHAEFSYLEDMLRNGALLPGPGVDPINTVLPGYEFPTGYDGARVLVRKMNGVKRWLISAWAADGIVRTVNVTIPVLGTVTVTTSPAASLYDARIVNGVESLISIDSGSMTPTPLQLPASTPDPDGAAPGSGILGDVNGDGQVTIYDAEQTAQKAIGLPVANFNATAAEVDGTGSVDIYDAYLIAEYAVASITQFPVQNN